MDSSYLNNDIQMLKFLKSNKVDKSLLHNLLASFPQIEHPSLALENLYEVHKHNKKLICLDAAPKSGCTLSSLIYIVDVFLNAYPTISLPEDVGSYLLILSSTRNSCQEKLKLVQSLTNNIEGIDVVDINQFFPITQKGKPPQIILPPTSIPTILLSTPGSFLKLIGLTPIHQAGILGVLYDECDLIKIYGGIEQLKEIYDWVHRNDKFNQPNLIVGSQEQCKSITGKNPTLIKIENEYEPNEEEDNQEQKVEKIQSVGNYFYYVAKDDVQQFILLYITLKLNLLAGKTLILVQDLQQLYQVQLFLQRIDFQRFQIYNHENPKTLKYYTLSTFNTGVIQVLVSTTKIFEELQTEFYERTTCISFYQKPLNKPSQRKGRATLLNNQIILLQIEYVQQFFFSLYILSHLHGFGNVLVIQNKDDESIENLLSWIESLKKSVFESNIKQYPLSLGEIEAFRYRIEDVIQNISKHQIKLGQQLDFKKKMIKSPDLADYFQNNVKEKELLQQQIVKLKASLRNAEIVVQGSVPDYLLPEVIKQQRKMQNEKSQDSRFSKVLVTQRDKEKERQKEKRRLLAQDTNNMLPIPVEKFEDVFYDYKTCQKETRKKQKITTEKYIYVNEDKEDPALVDASKLQILSNRKLWKLRHGFKLKKRNKRLERKGVFDT